MTDIRKYYLPDPPDPPDPPENERETVTGDRRCDPEDLGKER